MTRYVLYARGQLATDPYTRIYVPIFTEPERARAWLEDFIGCDEFERHDNVIHFINGFTVTSEQLPDILNAPLGYELPDIHSRRILRFKYGSWDGMSVKPARVEHATGETTGRVVREARPGRPAGYVTITELCAASGMLPMHARAALRASGRVKPDYGWAFDPAEVDTIKKICGME